MYVASHLYDDILIVPDNLELNFFVGELSQNMELVPKPYPINIHGIYQNTNEILLDVNNDGVDDFNFWVQISHSGQGWIYLLHYKMEGFGDNKICEYNGHIQLLDPLELVSDQFNWSEESCLMYYFTESRDQTIYLTNQTKYICFKIEIDGSPFWGWTKIITKGELLFNENYCNRFEIEEIFIQKGAISTPVVPYPLYQPRLKNSFTIA